MLELLRIGALSRREGLAAGALLSRCERAAERIPNNVLAVFVDGARHELLREKDEVRDRVLAVIDTFLDRHVSP